MPKQVLLIVKARLELIEIFKWIYSKCCWLWGKIKLNFLNEFTVNVGDKMKGLIGGCHTEPQENVDLNGGWVSSAKSKNGHQNARVETRLLSAKSEKIESNLTPIMSIDTIDLGLKTKS